MSVALAGLGTATWLATGGTADANQPINPPTISATSLPVGQNGSHFERVSLSYVCRLDRGTLRLEPSAEQVYALNSQRNQQPMTVCPERQSCQTLLLQKFTISCGGQRVPWVDVVTTLADMGLANKSPGLANKNAMLARGPIRLTVTDGRLGLLIKPRSAARIDPVPPAGRGLSGWCSEQFGGPAQPFLRQACNDARRIVSNLGGPPFAAAPPRPSEPATPQVVALPKGFAPLREVGARLLPPLAIAAQPSAGLSDEPAPNLLATGAMATAPAPEPNDRTADLLTGSPSPKPVTGSAPASTWITSVHLANATVAASSLAASERQLHQTNASVMASVAAALAAILAMAAAAIYRHRTSRATALKPVPVPTDSSAVVAAGTAQLCLPAPERLLPTDATGSDIALNRLKTLVQLGHRCKKPILGLRQTYHAMMARRRPLPRVSPDPRPRRTATEQAAFDALKPESRHLLTARDQITDRIETLRQSMHPLIRTAPLLQMALARDLTAGQRRLAKISVVSVAGGSLANEPADDAVKKAQSRLQRVTADLDRLQEIIAGATASFARSSSPRQLPRDLPEAYACLGVNPGVSDGTLKKLVDALRVSWHPDLATSPDDRCLRDERIKEINVAWDLISGRRTAG